MVGYSGQCWDAQIIHASEALSVPAEANGGTQQYKKLRHAIGCIYANKYI